MTDLVKIIGRMHEQLAEAWKQAQAIRLPASYRAIDRVVVMGMGGSALGAHVVRSTFADQLTVPIEVVNGYRLPGTANSRSLVILSSFSGTTEEVLTAYKAAKQKKLKMFVIAAGGELAKRARRDKVSGYFFNPKDLAPQPRYGTGFMMMGIVGALRSLGFLKLSEAEVKAVVAHLKKNTARAAQGKKIAKMLINRLPIVVSSEQLEGAAHVFANQMNESAKHFAALFTIPELNHHLMEGLTFPKSLIKQMTFVFVESKLYSLRVQKRYGLTETVVKKNGARVVRVALNGKTALEQAFELIQLGGYVTAEMARLVKVDPEKIPWVEWFKKQMGS